MKTQLCYEVCFLSLRIGKETYGVLLAEVIGHHEVAASIFAIPPSHTTSCFYLLVRHLSRRKWSELCFDRYCLFLDAI